MKIYIPFIALLVVLIVIVGCTTELNDALPGFIKNEVWHKIYDKYYKIEDINVVVHINWGRVSIIGNDNIDIHSCKLYIDDIEIELRNLVQNAFSALHGFIQGESYKIRIVVNEKIYEANFKIPYEASIRLTHYIHKSSRYYAFYWDLEQNHDAQYVGIILERNDVSEPITGYILAEIKPSRRSFTFNPNIIPSRYTFRGVIVGGLNYVVNEEVLFMFQIGNHIMK